MKKIHSFILSSITFCVIVGTISCEQLNLGLSHADVVEGLKEALVVSTDTSVAQARKTDGYYQNQAIKVLLPQEAEVVMDAVNIIPGGDVLVTELVRKINRAAEDAANQATPIFVDAITGITFQDAFAILSGTDDAATQYLKSNTSAALYTAYKPKIENSLSAVGAQQAWEEVITLYNDIPLLNDVNADLADHTTNKALDGLFYLVAEEEKKIRQNPLHRVTEILTRVFGG